VDRVNGAHIPEVTKKTAQHSSTIAPTFSAVATQEPAKPVGEISTENSSTQFILFSH